MVIQKCLEMAAGKKRRLQLALSVQHAALEYALFFWIGTSASSWTVCSRQL